MRLSLFTGNQDYRCVFFVNFPSQDTLSFWEAHCRVGPTGPVCGSGEAWLGLDLNGVGRKIQCIRIMQSGLRLQQAFLEGVGARWSWNFEMLGSKLNDMRWNSVIWNIWDSDIFMICRNIYFDGIVRCYILFNTSTKWGFADLNDWQIAFAGYVDGVLKWFQSGRLERWELSILSNAGKP